MDPICVNRFVRTETFKFFQFFFVFFLIHIMWAFTLNFNWQLIRTLWWNTYIKHTNILSNIKYCVEVYTEFLWIFSFFCFWPVPHVLEFRFIFSQTTDLKYFFLYFEQLRVLFFVVLNLVKGISSLLETINANGFLYFRKGEQFFRAFNFKIEKFTHTRTKN